MARKMQNKMCISHPQVSDKVTRLLLDATIMALMAAAAIWVLMMPVDAAEPTPPFNKPLTLWTDSLPSNFQIEAARHGLDVTAVERLEELDALIVTIRSSRGLTPLNTVQVLGNEFPTFQFDMMNNTEDAFELVEN